MSESDKRTATQRIEDLEKVVTVFYQSLTQLQNVANSLVKSQGDVGLLKEALKIINKKLEAVVQLAAPETGITSKSVNDLVVQMNVEDLKAQVAEHLASGNLVPADTVLDNGYLVCEEFNQDGTLANPRIQFRLDSQTQETAAAFKGKKVGDLVSFGENKFSAKILELYTLAEPKAPETQSATAETAPVAEAAPEQATEAPETTTAPVATEAPVPAATQDSPPAESPVGFSLNIHGQSESTLTAPNTTAQ